MLAARITLPHFSVSEARSLPDSVGESANGVLPRSAIRALIMGSASPALISRLSLSIISAAVFLGAPSPTQPLASYPGKNSATAGTSRSASTRVPFPPPTARRPHAQCAQPPGPDVSDGRGEAIKGELHLTTEKVVQHQPRAAIGHM